MYLPVLIAFMFSFCYPYAQQEIKEKSIYEFRVPSLSGDTIDFSKYKGKKILIVNTASKCGYTPQYAGLEKLYEQYKDKLVVIGFPANNFLFQEPGSNEKIKAFCDKNYGVTFPMSEKISVKGKHIHPLYVWLTNKKYNKKDNYSISWNFNKFLIDENGKIIAKFNSGTKPTDKEIIALLE